MFGIRNGITEVMPFRSFWGTLRGIARLRDFAVPRSGQKLIDENGDGSSLILKKLRFTRGSKTLSAPMVDATVGILKIIGVDRILELFECIIPCTIMQPDPTDRTNAGIFENRPAFTSN
ncbi:MAG: hypothetical protein AB8C13_02040 [Phycisphaerales bacterium]